MFLLLAPFAAAAVSACECAHEDDGRAELGAVPCCESLHPCCYEHGQEEPASPVIADLGRHNRVDPKADLPQLLPARVDVAIAYHLRFVVVAVAPGPGGCGRAGVSRDLCYRADQQSAARAQLVPNLVDLRIP